MGPAIGRVTKIRLSSGDVIENEDGTPLLFGLTHDRASLTSDGGSVEEGDVEWAALTVLAGGRAVFQVATHEHARSLPL